MLILCPLLSRTACVNWFFVSELQINDKLPEDWILIISFINMRYAFKTKTHLDQRNFMWYCACIYLKSVVMTVLLSTLNFSSNTSFVLYFKRCESHALDVFILRVKYCKSGNYFQIINIILTRGTSLNRTSQTKRNVSCDISVELLFL